MKNDVIIVAGGNGKRMKSNIRKQYLEINKNPILAYTIEKFESCEKIRNIILVVPEDDISYVKEEIVDRFSFKKVKKIVPGGEERQNSVYNGIMELDDTEILLIHDGVRPFVKREDIVNIIEETEKNNACILGVKVKDTVKRTDTRGQITDTPDRSLLWLAQTPQAFKFDIIKKAYEQAFSDGFYGTDDSMLVERLNINIKMVNGSYSNIKITTPEDLYLGEAILLND